VLPDYVLHNVGSTAYYLSIASAPQLVTKLAKPELLRYSVKLKVLELKAVAPY
jgi:hypothetical protein